MCSDTLNSGGEVHIRSVCCRLGMPEISPFVFIVAASKYMGFLALNKYFSRGGVLGAAEFRVFLMSDKYDRRYVSVRAACGFTLMNVVFPHLDGQRKGRSRGFHNIIGTSVCVALTFERARGTSKPGPLLAAPNISSVHGTT